MNNCLVTTKEIRDLAKKLQGETEESVKGLVALWQKENNKSIEEYPTVQELNDFRVKLRGSAYRAPVNSYTGDITPDANTIFVFGSNPEGRHGAGAAKIAREQFGAIYGQGEGLQGNAYALPTKRIKSITPKKTGRMTFSYGTDKRADIKSDTTIEAIINGERTATTRYSTDGHIDYWEDLKVGDIVAFKSSNDKTIVYVKITKPLTKLDSSTNAEEWSKKEGWSVEYYNSKVKPKVKKGQAYQMEYEFVDANGEKTITPLQIIENIKKLYETARQNPDKQFKVAYRNTDKASLNGYTGLEMIDMFLKAGSIPTNIVFSKEWVDTGKFNHTIKESEYSKQFIEILQMLITRIKSANIKEAKAAQNLYEWTIEAQQAILDAIEKGERKDEDLPLDRIQKQLNNLAQKTPEELAKDFIKALKEMSKDWGRSIAYSKSKTTEEAPIAKSIQKSKNTSVEEVVNMLDEALSSSFDTPKISSIEEQAKVDLDFDPRTRRDRVTLIARFFSNEVDKALQEINDSINKRMDTASDEERLQLQKELSSLDRFTVIKKYTPAGLFNRVLDIFQSYINDTEENRVKVELDKINSAKGADKYSDEQKLAAAKKKAAYKEQAYRKVVDNFKPLAEEASTLLVMTEGIKIDPNYIAPEDVNLNDDTPEGDSELDEQADDYNKEETFKDGWMTNFRQVSSHESLSQAVRKVIRQVPKLDYRGKYEKDDLGFTRYLDADYVHATFIDKLKDMITSEDMIPLMQELEKNKPWVRQVTKLLQGDETLFSQFYQDFRKDFMPYWIQKKKMMPDGTFKMQTIAVNKPEGVYYLLDAWRDNYENGIQLDDDSVYEKNGDINVENAEKGLKWVETLNNKFSNLDTEARLKLLEEDRIWNTILKLLNMIGIDANPSVLKNALTDIKTSDTIKFTDPIMLLLPQLNVIFSGIKKGDIKSETREDGTEKRGDLINTFGSAYNMIASMMANVTEDAIESSVRENDKSYYSHVNPNYLGKLIKQLKNVRGDKKRFEEFINTEFKQYEWFFKNGRWRSDWLEQLVNSEEMRRGLSHKVVLNSDKVDYTNWDDLDYTLALLTEYWGDPEDSRTSVKWAWYHVPILSDSPSAEFIRFRKYVSGVEYDENGNKLTYDDIILDKLTDLVNQEYDRIMLVRARDEELQNGNPNISPIANYDIVRKKDGSIKSMGGAEFKFLPALNSIRYDNGETFLDRLSRLSREGSGAELKDFIRGALREVMDNGFEEAYRDWARIGLLDETANGRYKYLPFAGQSQQNSRIAKSLIRAKEVLGTTLWTTDMELLLKDYNNNNPVDDRVAANLFQQVRDIVTQKGTRGDITKQEADSINRNLIVKNNAKAALREYYWNSKLATSQIIELTTTDLAFYKNVEDFQKRYKEVHAPALRMNTKATYKGKRIGRDWEKTIYLKDDEIVSSVLSDIETVLDERVKKHEMTKTDRDNIINKFKEVNVADAQAYRSLSSYRAVLGMSGQWTDEMEQAYNNFKNGTWNIADFNIIWQTKKPYVYTQINNMSGVEGHTDIKTPVQHKNSESLLLAMYALVAGPLGKSEKLRAINDFMEMNENQIDVVQFESTTKVGKQGLINLNTKLNLTPEEKFELDSKLSNREITQDQYNKIIEENTVPITSYKDTMDILKRDTGIGTGHENPNVVHKISYEDYGIQVATPEHVIDAVQLVGTQIRKLITADIAPDAIIEVDGMKMTKQEWLDLYNAINTENILQAFRDIDDIFKDPKKVEEILLEEMRGNQRYGIDMMRACTLDENGQFNIPLFDPVQSQKIQTLLNSIIKSRITKQKIKGGALIQVSDYGLTDELHIVFEGEGENKRIKYLECYMPAYSRKFYEPLMKEGTHELDITKLPEDLRKLIGYRVPTEDKYSMAPLYIKGFLPQQNGSAIMLPAEITTLSGSDFDVDKMYIMLPEFDIKEVVDKKSLLEAFKSTLGYTLSKDELLIAYDEVINGSIAFSEDSIEMKLYDFYTENKDLYTKKVIKKVKYDFNKTPQENSLEARNNLLIDMMWGVLTNADTASKILNPGGFDYQKKAARIVSILSSSYESDLRKDLGISQGSIITKLLSLDLDNLDKLAERTKKKLDPISPRTQVHLHQQNMTGAKLIGIYANHNANHALMQHTELGLDVENGSFVLNGKRLTSLHDIMNRDKEFISKNNAGFLAASVDNVKDPVLAGINQNTFTADASMLLSRLGYNPVEIGLLMAQPIIMDITQTYFRESREGKGKDTVIDEVLVEYKKKAAMMEEVTYDNYKNNDFLIEDLANNILIAKEMAGITNAHQTSDYSKVEFYKKQVAVGFLFKRIMRTADSLGQLVQATRADTPNGAAGPTIADTKLKIQKVQDFLKDMVENDKFPLVGADVIDDMISFDGNIDEIREQLLNSKLPFLQAFYTLGIKQSEIMLSKYFPQFTKSFDRVVDVLRSMTKTGRLNVKTMNSIYNDLLAYIMSKTDFFGAEPDWRSVDENGNPTKMITSADKRRDFINNFPTYFKKVVAENEDIADLEFIKRLRVIRANDTNPVDTVVFKNVGQLSPTLRERYMRDWASLLYMSNPEAQKLALNLFRYSFYRNGFAFGPSTFIHLAPVAVRNAVPEYIETLRSLLTSEDDYSNFVEQYIYNHLDNRKLVPEVLDDASTPFIGEDNEIKDEVTFVIDENANFGDKKVIKKRIDTPDGPVYDFFDFIARRIRGNYVYYRLTIDRVDESNVAVYRRIEPLGFRNSFIEYEYGKEASEMTSVIEKNSKNYNPNPNIDYDAIASFETPQMTEEDLAYSEMYRESFSEDALRQAYGDIYGAPLEVSQGSENDVTSIQPNVDYKDENGDNICGATTLYSL